MAWRARDGSGGSGREVTRPTVCWGFWATPRTWHADAVIHLLCGVCSSPGLRRFRRGPALGPRRFSGGRMRL
jgi:hypothetical protein